MFLCCVLLQQINPSWKYTFIPKALLFNTTCHAKRYKHNPSSDMFKYIADAYSLIFLHIIKRVLFFIPLTPLKKHLYCNRLDSLDIYQPCNKHSNVTSYSEIYNPPFDSICLFVRGQGVYSGHHCAIRWLR